MKCGICDEEIAYCSVCGRDFEVGDKIYCSGYEHSDVDCVTSIEETEVKK